MKLITLLLLLLAPTAALGSQMNGAAKSLNEKQASHFAALALKCVAREFPNKPEHVINNASEVKSPKGLHPAFFGCFDWHSSVHGHWMLIRLLKDFPSLPAIRDAIDVTITAKNIEIETAYLRERPAFERMYGWAWLLQLATELHGWDDGKRWAVALQPLVEEIVERAGAFLPKQTYPIRTGVHPNTAWGLALMLDHARTVRNAKLEALVVERALHYFANDVDYPAHLEPGGEDFFSPALVEADLMRRVLPPATFAPWLRAFL